MPADIKARKKESLEETLKAINGAEEINNATEISNSAEINNARAIDDSADTISKYRGYLSNAGDLVKGGYYEALYTELLGRGEQLHQSNKRRIRRGLLFLMILPFILDFIRWMTDSDKIVFLIIWIIIMFIVSAYLIGVEYLDSTVEGVLRDVTDTEAGFDTLLPSAERTRADLHERIRARIAGRRELLLKNEELRLQAEAHEIEDEIQREEMHAAMYGEDQTSGEEKAALPAEDGTISEKLHKAMRTGADGVNGEEDEQ